MPQKLRVRNLTSDEQLIIERLAHSRNAPAREVERAQIILYSHQGESVQRLAKRLGLCTATVRFWIKRSNTDGIEGLNDEQRLGDPAIYQPDEVSEIIELSL
jgi:transposase